MAWLASIQPRGSRWHAAERSAISDDALKDQHVAGWLFEFEASKRDRWLELRVDSSHRPPRRGRCKGSHRDGIRTFLEGWAQLRAVVISLACTAPRTSVTLASDVKPHNQREAMPMQRAVRLCASLCTAIVLSLSFVSARGVLGSGERAAELGLRGDEMKTLGRIRRETLVAIGLIATTIRVALGTRTLCLRGDGT